MRQIDVYSYQCGVVDCFNEMVAAGVKQLALAHPMSQKHQQQELAQFCEKICEQYGTKFMPESDLLITDLFEKAMCQNCHTILFYKDDAVLTAYENLKQKKKQLVATGNYDTVAREDLACAFGALLGYTQSDCVQLIKKNVDKE